MGKSPAVSYVTPLIKRHLFQYYLCASRNLRYSKSHVPNIQKDEVSTTPESSTMTELSLGPGNVRTQVCPDLR